MHQPSNTVFDGWQPSTWRLYSVILPIGNYFVVVWWIYSNDVGNNLPVSYVYTCKSSITSLKLRTTFKSISPFLAFFGKWRILVKMIEVYVFKKLELLERVRLWNFYHNTYFCLQGVISFLFIFHTNVCTIVINTQGRALIAEIQVN